MPGFKESLFNIAAGQRYSRTTQGMGPLSVSTQDNLGTNTGSFNHATAPDDSCERQRCLQLEQSFSGPAQRRFPGRKRQLKSAADFSLQRPASVHRRTRDGPELGRRFRPGREIAPRSRFPRTTLQTPGEGIPEDWPRRFNRRHPGSVSRGRARSGMEGIRASRESCTVVIRKEAKHCFFPSSSSSLFFFF